jgi:hypothetical protein
MEGEVHVKKMTVWMMPTARMRTDSLEVDIVAFFGWLPTDYYALRSSSRS